MWTSPFPVQAPRSGYGDSAMLPPQPAPASNALVPTLLGAAVGAGAGLLFAPNRRAVGAVIGGLAGAAGVFIVKKYAIPGGAQPGQLIRYESTPGVAPSAPSAPAPMLIPEAPPPPPPTSGGGPSTMSAATLFIPAAPPPAPPPPPAPAPATRIVASAVTAPRTFSTASLFTPSPAASPPPTRTLPGGGGPSFRF